MTSTPEACYTYQHRVQPQPSRPRLSFVGYPLMPTWLQWLVWIAGGVTGAGIIWTKFIRPVSRFIARIEAMCPLLVELTDHLKGSPQSFQILKEVIAQFRTDSGSSLRDVVDRLEKAAKENRAAGDALKVEAEILRVNVAAVKALAVEDRAAMAKLVVAVDLLSAKVDHRQTQHDTERRAATEQSGA